MKYSIFFGAVVLLLFSGYNSNAQCVQFIHNPADTALWVHGSSQPDHPGHYYNDTFVVCNSNGGENNFLYNTIPSTLYDASATFTASFDFRIDSNNDCSDGLTFWFFTSSLYQLGSPMHEGGAKGFPDSVSGFALTFETIGCTDDIYMKKINSNSFYFDYSTTEGDTNICEPVLHQTFLTDSQWHHCVVNYSAGHITTTFDGGMLVMSGDAQISGTGHFGFMGTNGGGYSRKCIKNIQICATMGTPTTSSDSFSTYINHACNGPQVTVRTNSNLPTHSVKVNYGDGLSDSVTFISALPYGIATLTHTYAAAGTYTIKQKLYNGTILIDSLEYNYTNTFCATLPVKFFYDSDLDGSKDADEFFTVQPSLTRVDSNGVPIDTISALSGFYYTAMGNPGDVYSFHVITPPGNLSVSSPSSGVIYDTLSAGTFVNADKYFGLSCSSAPGFDLGVVAVIPVTGAYDQWANVYVQNTYCTPTASTLTLHYSPKYQGSPTQITPAAASVSGSTIIWNLAALSSASPAPAHIHYEAEHGTIPLTIGDTVHTSFSLSPTSGDMNIANNSLIIIDTVRAGCDPNAMWVSPAGCMTFSSLPRTMTYTIHFENTGTDTAYNIYVLDTLSDNLDLSSMRLVLSSHTMFVSVLNDNAGHNILKFDFPDIKLADSSHHDACDGALIYTIDTKPGLPVGSAFLNRAGIYFDGNSVVMTNEVDNRIGNCGTTSINPTAIHNDVLLSPNPVSDMLSVQFETPDYNTLTVSNAMGQLMMTKSITDNRVSVDVHALPAGIYYVTLKGANGGVVKKLVKL